MTETRITNEALIRSPFRGDFRVELLVKPGDLVAQGQPVLRATKAHAFTMTAPMSARVASVDMDRGHRLNSILFYYEPDAGRHAFEVPDSPSGAEIWTLLANTGLWRAFRQRPGFAPAFGEVRPSAIVVMAHDTRPGAGCPLDWVQERGAEIKAGLAALSTLTQGPIFLVKPRGAEIDMRSAGGRVRTIEAPATHPWGLAGIHILRHAPASFTHPVWDIHIEALADIGALMRTGHIPETRHVALSGPGMRNPLLLKVQPGADIRELLLGKVVPGKHLVLSGSPIDGTPARWLSWGSRQITVLTEPEPAGRRHWLRAALGRSSRPLPVIPTAGLDQALGGTVPVMPLIRAISSGDTESAIALGALSLVEEDLALVDYITQADPPIAAQLRLLIDQVAEEGGI
ncbi:Na(+)-translocating NADH-quinone reductase subunit A [Pseudooceanicola sp.]|uniref:Na(+)-translocating NADH-quinone reductase subunit A n=1 Tax=Pseudooceanicola sp. TaxID=1914328 RepID=UPI002601F99B|nr:Na(+)-translocating NADH-quinone reductase subunit A [Pseudooceanicola sp.]MDF1855946.1 Na(+)-translocating NADH-quinone reductase subunit A [Pseudooceanicola sp.]